MRSRPLPAYAVYLLLQGWFMGAFFLAVTLSGVFAVREAHLGPLQLVLVGTTLEATALVFQLPTGVLADAYGRKRSVLIGMVLTGLGLILWGSRAQFATILLAQVLWGLGYTFLDGAQQAWIAGEVGEARAAQAFLRGTQAGQAGALFGIAAAVALGGIALGLPLIVGGALDLLLALLLAFVMPERGFHSPPDAGPRIHHQFGHALHNAVTVVRSRPQLLTIFGISAIFGAASEGFDRLRDLHLLQDVTLPQLGGLGVNLWFGLIQVGGLLFSIVAAELVKRRLDTSSHLAVARTLATINGLLVLAVIGFALAHSLPLALAAVWSIMLLRRTEPPLVTVWLNQNLAPAVRATVFSLQSLSDALGQVAGGPLLGLIAAAISVRAGLIAAACFLVPVLLLYARTMRGHVTEHAPA